MPPSVTIGRPVSCGKTMALTFPLQTYQTDLAGFARRHAPALQTIAITRV